VNKRNGNGGSCWRSMRYSGWSWSWKWETIFIEDNMSCNVNSTGGKMKAFVAEMVFAISNEHTRSRPKGKFGGVIWLEKWPAFTAKIFQEFVIWRDVKKTLIWRFLLGYFRRKSIYEICCCFKSWIPKDKWNSGSSKKGLADFNYVAMFSFNCSHLMMVVWTA
jgi:hypothetical protein